MFFLSCFVFHAAKYTVFQKRKGEWIKKSLKKLIVMFPQGSNSL